ncbi:AEC family transporter [Actibacterium pelagium]|uniref:Malonate transporter n=1 Tax=Actibacterium pelagium TaxID=2029103 RepID=A0A917EL79_9RHOB|nr:AEC family transporter [Actibacterium pelagium]GGE57780.1 malonate transporter [Actibacterium pelagium]
MQALVQVVLPVFLVIGFGYAIAWRNIMSSETVEGLMTFAQKIAIPCLLFRAISSLDLSQEFDLRLLASFYTGALTGFSVGLLGARYLFGRPWTDSVAIGFIGLFSNSVLLGLPITERAYGPDALSANFTIIALHSPFCYAVGITAMEIARARGKSPLLLFGSIVKSIFSNALVIGIVLGFAVNLSGLPTPEVVANALDLVARAGIPAALFGLGGVLWRYRPEGDLLTIAFACAMSLIVHPLITFGLSNALDLSQAQMRSAVLTAAMAPGVNAYIFADMYGCAKRVAATSVLVGTALTVLTAWGWLTLLG